MKIQLFDLDVHYEVSIDVTSNGEDVIKIAPNTGLTERVDDYDIYLDCDLCEELIRTLEFVNTIIKNRKLYGTATIPQRAHPTSELARRRIREILEQNKQTREL